MEDIVGMVIFVSIVIALLFSRERYASDRKKISDSYCSVLSGITILCLSIARPMAKAAKKNIEIIRDAKTKFDNKNDV